jgi:hypothetical protein
VVLLELEKPETKDSAGSVSSAWSQVSPGPGIASGLDPAWLPQNGAAPRSESRFRGSLRPLRPDPGCRDPGQGRQLD